MLKKIAFIGSGELAESLLKGFLAKNFVSADRVWMNNRSNKGRLNDLEKKYHVHITSDKKTAIEGAEAVILAFRPGNTREALEGIKGYLTVDQLVISLMVGVPSVFINKAVGKKLQIVRAMPNTSASIGLSATGIAPGEFVSGKLLDTAVDMFETVGTATVVEEKEIDVIAGLSGSGPAYLYYLAEAMQRAGIREGISGEAATRLVLQTLKGATQLLEQSGESAEDLLKAVATPSGTTQAGIDTLDRHNVRDAVADCVHQAIVRAEEMSAPFSE
ncbi:pyrroline-5-carboxylate reductase [Sporolactobacillus shoreae]|nr:pyrroline-5-carboxylate reductase [Sporolactobacillus shoreae]